MTFPASRLPVVLIAAVAQNGVIGRAGGMPWHLPGDLAHFRDATMGQPVLMGRKTFESIGRPLPGRATIVLSGDPAFAASGVTVAVSLTEALAQAEHSTARLGADRLMIAGGATVYRAFMPWADRLIITEVADRPEGDVLFPVIDPQLWAAISRTSGVRRADDSAFYSFVEWHRRSETTR